MTEFPDTKQSLIIRLGSLHDAAAWEDFSALYQPVVYRLARNYGMQDADAQELAQETMVAVMRAVSRWRPDAEEGQFRNWLRTIAKNLIVNFLTRNRNKSFARGDTVGWDRLLEIPCSDNDATASHYESELQREQLAVAARIVRTDFAQTTWDAFWITAVDGVSIAVASSRLKISRGQIYLARSRVMAKLRKTIEEMSL